MHRDSVLVDVNKSEKVGLEPAVAVLKQHSSHSTDPLNSNKVAVKKTSVVISQNPMLFWVV